MDPTVARACDAGKPFIDFDAENGTAQAFARVFEPLLRETETRIDSNREDSDKEYIAMKIAIPLAGGKLTAHFGHCEQFAVVDVDSESKTITDQAVLAPPAHEPGVLPAWLAEQGVGVVIAGGMGQRAQGLFSQQNIQVVVGAPAETPERLVTDYLAGTLQVGDNVCDH
jgi:predicted Fe-Mo cluster-binding NifX family protein